MIQFINSSALRSFIWFEDHCKEEEAFIGVTKLDQTRGFESLNAPPYEKDSDVVSPMILACDLGRVL